MGISLKTHKLLWGRSGNKCAMPDCHHDLIADETETDDESIIGDEAHIVGKNSDAARGISDLTAEERDQYDNLVLLCRKHHKIVDDQPKFYTVEKLKEIKKLHEEWVKSSLHLDKEKEKDELTYASYIDSIIKMFDFDHWNTWTSSLISNGQPAIMYNKLQELQKIPDFIVSRFWPRRYTELEGAIFNLKNVLNDLIKVFLKYADEDALSEAEEKQIEIRIWTQKFYKIREWNPELYHELSMKFDYHVALVEDLVLELTRAANLVIEKLRKYIAPKYREDEGKLLLTSGPTMEFSWETFKVEYTPEQKRENHPYHALELFMTERQGRDIHYGEGVDGSYLPLKF